MLAAKVVAVLTILIVLDLSSAAKDKDFSDETVENAGNSTSGGSRGRSYSSGDGSRRSRKKFHSNSRGYFYDHCRDKTYNIQEVHDLTKRRHELDCIYRRGVAPATIPEGSYRGTILQVLKTDWFNPFASFMWNGKQVMKTSCNGKPSYVGWTNVVGSPAFPFTVRIGPLDERLAHGDHDDDRDTIVMDYTKDVAKVCPEFRSVSKSRHSLHNLMPIRNIINVMRIVGEKRDGSAIYLGKSYMKNGFGEDKRVKNIAHFAVVNYDPNITPPETYPSAESDEDSRRGSGRNMNGNPAPPPPPAPTTP